MSANEATIEATDFATLWLSNKAAHSATHWRSLNATQLAAVRAAKFYPERSAFVPTNGSAFDAAQFAAIRPALLHPNDAAFRSTDSPAYKTAIQAANEPANKAAVRATNIFSK